MPLSKMPKAFIPVKGLRKRGCKLSCVSKVNISFFADTV